MSWQTGLQGVNSEVDTAVEEARLINVERSLSQDLYHQRGWTDGLAVVPATAAQVDTWLDELGAADLRDASIGPMPPSLREVTVESVIVNTIMAGGEPWHVPIVIAAIAAMMQPQFNLAGVQATTHPCTALIVVEHPGDDERFKTKTGVLGSGDRATAAVGRAVRLCMQNVGGARAGMEDRATQGSPAKFSYCAFTSHADRPAAWLPRGGFISSDESPKVHVYAVEGAHNVHDATNKTAIGILQTIGRVLVTPGGNDQYFPYGSAPIFLSPEHAEIIAADGFSLRDVQSTLYEVARLPWDIIATGGRFIGRQWNPWREGLYQIGNTVPIVDRPENFHIYIVGGPGYHSAVSPGFGISGHAAAPLGADLRSAVSLAVEPA